LGPDPIEAEIFGLFMSASDLSQYFVLEFVSSCKKESLMHTELQIPDKFPL